MKITMLTAFSLLTLPALAANGSAFNEMRALVYAKPLTTLPQHPGLDPKSIVLNLIGSEHRPTHGLGVRSRQTMVDTSDVRDPEPKWLHPRGACASGRWIMTENSPASGLFAKGVNVPALLRISSGDGRSQFDPKTDGRIFGMAVKLFPSSNQNKRVSTANIFTLDQYGFERTKRKHVFRADAGTEPVYFTNVAPAKSALGKFLSAFFDRFDLPNFARPLYAVAASTTEGETLYREDTITPYEIRFVPVQEGNLRDTYADFRTELLQSAKRSFKIMLYSFDGKSVLNKQIGRLDLDPFVVSDFCDLDLHFHHHPIEDQWSKYDDYEVVRGLK